MKERVFLKRKEITMILSKSLFFLLVICFIISGCKKTKSYEPLIPYNTTIDTATLKIKVVNPPLPSGVDVTEPSTKVILFLFDSKNLFLSQASYNGILTEDTSIVLNGLPMGHYTALVVVDGPGITNLNYLEKGKQSYQEVVDTLQSLLTGTYVGTYQDINYVGLSQTLLVNQKYNEGTLTMQPLYSIISQITFDLSQVYTAWQKIPQLSDGLNLLVFQNGGFVNQIPVKDEDIQKKSFSVPIAQGANYSFLFTDITNQPTICKLADSLIKGVSTIASVQALAERYNNNIRMGVGVLEATVAKTLNALPQATTTNLMKTTYNALVENAMAETIFTIDAAQNIPTTKPTNSDGLAFLEFQNGKLIRKMPVTDDEFATGKITAQILKGDKYDFLLVDLLKDPGQFELKKITDTPGYSVVTINSIQGNVEPYNNKNNSGIMRLGAPSALPQSTTINKDQSIEIINGLSVVSFDLANLKSKPNTDADKTDGFALLEFKDGVLIKKTDILYTDAGTTIPATYTTSVVKSTKYSFWFVDLAKSTDGTFQLKNEITKNGKLVGNISIANVKNIVEPYLNQNMRMGTIAEGDLTTATANLSVASLIQQVKLKFTGSIGCNDWNTSPNWSVLILDQSGYYKRTAIGNVTSSTTLFATPFNIFTGSKYYIAAVGGLGAKISDVELPTTNFNTLNTINNSSIQQSPYSWLAIDSCLAGQTTYENHVTTGTITITGSTTTKDIKVFTKIDQITLQTIPQLRALTSPNFACNPIRITGIVTSDGIGENDMQNLIILQDASATTNAAIPIQFKTATGLKKGDKVTIAIQDGDLTRLNANASGLLVLQNVTYTPDPSNPLDRPTIPYSPNVQSLGNITYSNLTTAKMDNYEAMLVSVSNVEFRYWKGRTYYNLTHSPAIVDSIQLRDASVVATTLPSTRAVFRLKMNTTLAIDAGFGFEDIPIGKSNVTGILAKNSTNAWAIQPRNKNDITTTTNTMANRIDAGVAVDWIGNAQPSPYNSLNMTTTTVGGLNIISASGQYAGVARENSYFTANSTLGTALNLNTSGSSGVSGNWGSPDGGVRIDWPTVLACTGTAILVNIDTKEMVAGEDLQVTALSGQRGSSASVGSSSDIQCSISYSTDGGVTYKSVTTPQSIGLVMPAGGASGANFQLKNAAFTADVSTPFTLSGVGGSSVILKFAYIQGNFYNSISNDHKCSFTRFTVKQIP